MRYKIKRKRIIIPDKVKKLFEENLKRTFEILNNSSNFQLFMCYFKFLDSIQHICFKEEVYIKRCYLKIEDVVRKIKKKTNKNDLVLIISDHGFDLEKGDHSNHGFYSSNIKLNLNNPKITDFFDIISRFAQKGFE
jgi:adenylosuccinate synthase